MSVKKMLAIKKKKVVCVLEEHEYVELLSSLKYENITHPVKLLRFFIDSYLSGDKDARAVTEKYKQKYKITGRIKRTYIEAQEALAKNNKVLYNLDNDDIDDIYDILDQTMPD